MPEIKNDIALSGTSTRARALQQSVVKTLLYYDIFSYPLKGCEVYRFLEKNSATEADVVTCLELLVNQKCIFRFGEFYSIQPCEENINRRLKGNREAERYIELAQKKATLISAFPFVRAVMASGSLSKGYMDEKSDLDFFVITKPGRLWIARTLLVMYKRIFLGNSHKHFCVNYLIDYNHLEIEEKNIFTATELATVIPLRGGEYYKKLLEANGWLKSFFPNYRAADSSNIVPAKASAFKRTTEKFLDVFLGGLFDKIFMRLTLNRWKKLYQKQYSKKDFDIAFKTRKYASKNHPNHYQRKVTELYEKKLYEFAKQFDWIWHE